MIEYTLISPPRNLEWLFAHWQVDSCFPDGPPAATALNVYNVHEGDAVMGYVAFEYDDQGRAWLHTQPFSGAPLRKCVKALIHLIKAYDTVILIKMKEVRSIAKLLSRLGFSVRTDELGVLTAIRERG